MRHRSGVVHVAALLVVLVCARSLSSQSLARPALDRDYTLEASVLGYRGVGGDIDGIRNPVLFALTGDRVRITIVNTDLVLHDIALEAMNIRSPQVLDRGASANITFVAKKSDTYYCTIPGHRMAGMEGRLDVSDAPRPRPRSPSCSRRSASNIRMRQRSVTGSGSTT